MDLGRYELAAKYLSQAHEGMANQPTALEWYLEDASAAALTEFSLQRGDQEQARIEAQRFLETSLATSERTW